MIFLFLHLRYFFSEKMYKLSSTNSNGSSSSSFQLSKSAKIMVQRAIASAAGHGIEMCHGRANAAAGDCSIEAPLYNVNDRKCFNEIFEKSIDYYRKLWLSEGEKIFFNTPFNPGYSKSQWEAGFQTIKETNIYEVESFGDFILPSVACGIKKKILIFNTNVDFPREPVTVINPADFQVEPTSDNPIVLAYNLVHYESLHPVSSIDDQKFYRSGE